MYSIEDLIGKLLLRHNCVIVPSFGGFVAKQSSARIDYRNGLMLPPRKSLLFNRSLVQNDGLLIAELAQQNNTSYADAEKLVKEKVDTWYGELRNGNRINIDKVGFLFIDAEKNIGFEQDRFFNLLMSSFGMGNVHFVSDEEVESIQRLAEIKPIKAAEEHSIQTPLRVEEAESELVKQTVEAEFKSVTLPELKRHHKPWRYVAAACLLPIAFYSFWIPMKTNVLESGMLSIKDFNPFYQSSEGIYSSEKLKNGIPETVQTESLEQQLEKIKSGSDTYMYNFSEDLFIPVKLDSFTDEKLTPVQEETSVGTTSNNQVADATQGNIHFIVGCFGSKSNADKLVASLNDEGFNAQIVDQKGGLYRVSCGSVKNDEQLNNLRSKATTAGYQGWVLK